jgi:hypothetical protein
LINLDQVFVAIAEIQENKSFIIMPEIFNAKGLKTKEIVRAEILITENLETIRRKWNNVFGT